MAASRGLGLDGQAASSSTLISRVHPHGWAQTCPLQCRRQEGLMAEPRTVPLVVASVEDVTPYMRRIQLAGPSLEAFEYFPGQDLALPVVRDDGSIVRRRYTIRRFDPARRLLDLEFLMHGDGPAIPSPHPAPPGVAIHAIDPPAK